MTHLIIKTKGERQKKAQGVIIRMHISEAMEKMKWEIEHFIAHRENRNIINT